MTEPSSKQYVTLDSSEDLTVAELAKYVRQLPQAGVSPAARVEVRLQVRFEVLDD